MKPKKPKPTQPGGIPAQAPGESDVDEAINAAQQGKAHKVAKARAPVQPAPEKGDPARPAKAAVNQDPEMTYAKAMQLLEKGELKRSVLTEQGWVVAPSKKVPPGLQA